jgi:hypothetical protein
LLPKGSIVSSWRKDMKKEKMNNRIMVFWFCFLSFLCLHSRGHAKNVEYDLFIDYQEVNYSGTPVEAMTINNGIPGPTIEVDEGDIVQIRQGRWCPLPDDTSYHAAFNASF